MTMPYGISFCIDLSLIEMPFSIPFSGKVVLVLAPGIPVMKSTLYPLSFQDAILSSKVFFPRPLSDGFPPTPYTITASALLSISGIQPREVWNVVLVLFSDVTLPTAQADTSSTDAARFMIVLTLFMNCHLKRGCG